MRKTVSKFSGLYVVQLTHSTQVLPMLELRPGQGSLYLQTTTVRTGCIVFISCVIDVRNSSVIMMHRIYALHGQSRRVGLMLVTLVSPYPAVRVISSKIYV